MMARSAGFEPTASASAGLRSILLSYERTNSAGQADAEITPLVPKVGFEPTRPCGHYALNVARLPFRHFGTSWLITSGGRCRTRTCDLFRVKEALLPAELTAPLPSAVVDW
jgi:hypothetical protein